MDAGSGGRSPAGPGVVGPPEQEWGPTAGAGRWEAGTLTRVDELRALQRWAEAQRTVSDEAVRADIGSHLDAAAQALKGGRRTWRRAGRARLERATSNVDAAESLLLGLAPDSYVRGQLPSLLAHVQRHLPLTDPRRIRIEQLAHRAATAEAGSALTAEDRAAVVTATRAASSAALRDRIRVATFRAVVGGAAVALAAVAAAAAVIGLRWPGAVPLCFTPEHGGRVTVVCPLRASASFPVDPAGVPAAVAARTPSPADILVVELVGLAAAAVAAAAAVRRIRGSADAFGLPVTLALLKLPAGALTAFLGLVVLRGGFVPGLTALDSSAQILAWAAVLGYAQQLLTRPVDQQAQSVLGEVVRDGRPNARGEEDLLRQVTLAVPAIGPRLEETLIESVLGPPSPPYEGFVAVETTEPDGETVRVVVWFQTSRPESRLSAPIQLRGSRWPPGGDGPEVSPVVVLTVRLYRPADPRSPFSATVRAPTEGVSDQAAFETARRYRAPAGDRDLLEVTCQGRLVQVVDLTPEAHRP